MIHIHGIVKLAISIVLTGAACISCATIQYDDQADKLVTKLQSEVNAQFVSLISLEDQIVDLNGAQNADSNQAIKVARSKIAYNASIDFYNGIDVDLTSLKFRVDANPNQNITLIDADIDRLRAGLLGTSPLDDKSKSFRYLHHSGNFNRSDIVDARTQFNTEFQIMIEYYAVIKPGTSAKASSASGKKGKGTAKTKTGT